MNIEKELQAEAIGYLRRRIEELEKENAELKQKYEKVCTTAHNRGDFCICAMRENRIFEEKLTEAKEIILKLYNAGRDVLMCRDEEKAYDNLSNAINDKSIEQFLSGVEK